MRVFTFISKKGDGLALAQRIRDEGHRVVFYINDPSKRALGDGLIEKSSTDEQLVGDDGTINTEAIRSVLYPKPDCVVFDMVGKGLGKLADIFRGKDIPVVGGSQWGDQVELDKSYGKWMMKISGIKEASEQEHGIKVSTELWFNGKEVLNVNHTMEEKELMDGGIGPKVGSMGSLVWCGSRDSRLYKEGIGKLTSALEKVTYRGAIRLDVVVNDKGLYGLDFTAGFSYDSLYAFLELYQGRINDLLYGCATGVLNTIPTKLGFGISVLLGLMPYPILNKLGDYSKDTLLEGFTKQILKHTWFYDVYKKLGSLACAGNGGKLGSVSAYGSTLREARRRAYRTISNLSVSGVMYRRDIGQRVLQDMTKLKEWGWL